MHKSLAQHRESVVGRVLHISCVFPLSDTKRLVTYGQSGVVGDTFSVVRRSEIVS